MTERALRNCIYLAGGFSSGWQKVVHETLPDAEIHDPSKHGLREPSEYTKWDLSAIEKSYYVLAYMEEHNPGGYALALEIGYAKALGRLVILVEEHPTIRRRRSFDMVREVADFRFATLPEALRFLQAELQIEKQRAV